jgi:hypothetical protein
MTSRDGGGGSQAGIKSLLRVEVTYTPEGIGKGRCRVEILQRVPDGGDGQTKWQRIGTIGTSKAIWEDIEAALLLGACEVGMEVEFSATQMEVEAESDWGKARREAQEGAIARAKKLGVKL